MFFDRSIGTFALIFSLAVVLALPLHAREWTNAAGTFRLEAEFAGVDGTKVKLQRPDGRILTVPVTNLSAADQDFIRAQSAGPTPVVADVEEALLSANAAMARGDLPTANQFIAAAESKAETPADKVALADAKGTMSRLVAFWEAVEQGGAVASRG